MSDSPSEVVLRALLDSFSAGDPRVSSAAHAAFAVAARSARGAAARVACEHARAARARALGATGRCVADTATVVALRLLADLLRDAPRGSVDEATRNDVRAVATGAGPRRTPLGDATPLRLLQCAHSPRSPLAQPS